MIFKPKKLDYIEQHYMDWLNESYAVNLDNGEMTGMRAEPQVVLQSRRAIPEFDAGVLRHGECFMRTTRSKKAKGGFLYSPSLKALFIPNETAAFEVTRTGVVIVYDDKAPMLSNKKLAYTRNHQLLCHKVSQHRAQFILDREAGTRLHPNKIVVLGYGNVKVINGKGDREIVLLDFAPMNREYNIGSLRRRFVKQKLKESKGFGERYE